MNHRGTETPRRLRIEDRGSRIAAGIGRAIFYPRSSILWSSLCLCASVVSSEPVRVLHQADFLQHLAWSPDGTRIAWVSTRDKNPEIYVVGADGKNVRRLTNDSGFDYNPQWSPDGKRLAFCSTRAGNFEIHVMNADGSDVRRLTHHPKM